MSPPKMEWIGQAPGHLVISTGMGRKESSHKATLKDSSFFADVYVYPALMAKNEKLLVILPPTGGTNILDHQYARLFQKNGYQVVILDNWSGASDTSIDFFLHQRVHAGAQKALELILNNYPAQFRGVLGTSLGGIFASTAAHYQKNIHAIFSITAGTPISDVIVHSEQEILRELRHQRAEKLNIKSPEEQIRKIRESFELEPMDLPPQHKQKRLGLSIALKDRVVPTLYQNKLKEFWNPDVLIESNYDHFWGIVTTWLFHRYKILRFFEKSRDQSLTQAQPSAH